MAQIGGDHIYGGWVDWSVGEDGVTWYNPNVTEILEIQGDDDISSDPIRNIKMNSVLSVELVFSVEAVKLT